MDLAVRVNGELHHAPPSRDIERHADLAAKVSGSREADFEALFYDPATGHYYEPHELVEDAVRETGVPPDRVPPEHIAAAAELVAQQGYSPQDAFPIAFVRSLIEAGHIPRHVADEVIGHDQVQAILDTAAEGGREPSDTSAQASGAGAVRPTAEAKAPVKTEQAGGAGGAANEAAEGTKAGGRVRAEPTAGAGAEAGEGAVQHLGGGERAAEAATEQPRPDAEAGDAAANKPAKITVKAPVEGGKPFEGMIENQEQYKQNAKERREENQGGTHEIYKTKRAEEAARHGRTVEEANEERAKLVKEHEKKFTAALKEVNLARDEIPDEVWRDAIDGMIDHGHDPFESLDLAMAKAERLALQEEGEREIETSAHRPSEEAPFEGPEARAPQPETGVTTGAGETAEPAGRPGATERTEAGEQHVLPGAERISDAEHAQRGADAGLKPSVAQKPADEGLFGDESKQTDLVDLARKEEKAAHEASNFTIHPATRVPTEREAQLKGGQYSSVVHRIKPFSAERGYGDTPLSAQNDGLRRLKTTYRLQEPVEAAEASVSDADIAAYNEAVKKVRDRSFGEPEKPSRSRTVNIATALAERLSRGEAITNKTLYDEATKAFGGTMAEGKFDRKDAHDALELAVNMMVKSEPMLRADDGEWQKPVKRLEDILGADADRAQRGTASVPAILDAADLFGCGCLRRQPAQGRHRA
jgi:hypothetical protein